jgi:hypothetical protein
MQTQKIEPKRHFYVLYTREPDPRPVYERTCGTERAALDRVVTLRRRGDPAFVMLNALSEGSGTKPVSDPPFPEICPIFSGGWIRQFGRSGGPMALF